jgi:hypothetical protein
MRQPPLTLQFNVFYAIHLFKFFLRLCSHDNTQSDSVLFSPRFSGILFCDSSVFPD